MVEVVARNIGFSYPGATHATLDDLSFTVPSNNTLSLLGSSGAGKTTLLKVLSGLLPCNAGSLCFDGKEVLHLEAGERGVSQVFQFPVLFDSLSVLDNIAFPLRALGMTRRERQRKAQAIAELLEIDEWLHEKPASLALFQAQIAGFAKALVRPDTALVLLDEPLTAVEPALKWRLRGLLKRAQEELQVSMIYVTHDQTEALTIADSVSVLHEGAILQTGSARQLYNFPEHVEVARFIGSPGMNIVRGEIRGDLLRVSGMQLPGTQLTQTMQVYERSDSVQALADGAVMVGFRPEWAHTTRNGAARIQDIQIIGADDNARVGFVELDLDGQTVHIRQSLTQEWIARDASAELVIERALVFRDEQLVASVGVS